MMMGPGALPIWWAGWATEAGQVEAQAEARWVEGKHK